MYKPSSLLNSFIFIINTYKNVTNNQLENFNYRFHRQKKFFVSSYSPKLDNKLARYSKKNAYFIKCLKSQIRKQKIKCEK